MASALRPALVSLENALNLLEETLDQHLAALEQDNDEDYEDDIDDEDDGDDDAIPQLDLSVRNERDVNRKVATRLDQTISRLEMLLSQE